MKIIKNDNFHAGRNCGERTEKVKYIVIHYTGSEGTAANNVAYFNGGNRGASAHYFVDRSGEIREYCDPAKWYAWHCGGSIESGHHPLHGICTNRNSIGIEICTHNNGNRWVFTAQAVAAALELTKYLMQKFNVPAANVCRHWDVTGKYCPRVPGWGAVGGSAEWDYFKASLTATPASADPGQQADAVPHYYRVRKTWADTKSQVGAYSIYANATAKADEMGPEYAVFDWNGKEMYRKAEQKKEEEKKEEITPDPAKAKEIDFFYPGYTRQESPYDSNGAGVVFRDQNGHVMIVDLYMKNSAAANRVFKYLKDEGITEIDTVVLTHPHGDHGGGIFRLFENGYKVRNFVCYDPASLKLAGDGTKNGRSVQEDKEYLQKLISLAKSKGASVRYVKTGDEVKVGEMTWEVYRNQPTHWSEYDTGEGWAYVNDGSICLYNRQIRTLLCGDADAGPAAEHFGDVVIILTEVGHHGNNGTMSSARALDERGCELGIECNNEKGSPGSCEFTRYGSGRMKEAGIEVIMLNADIFGVVKAGKMTVKQGSKTWTFNVPFASQLYRVRKTWADSKSQKGAYSVLANAKAEADKWAGEYAVFDWNGKEVYRPAKASAGTSAPAADVQPKTENEKFIENVGKMAREDMKKTGICAAITVAQAILESGWGKSELAVNANNLFGMKKSLSGNTWAGSTWDGKSVYSKDTKEVYASGPATVRADFRAYPSWSASVNDHSAYLAGAKNGSALRYKGLVGEKDYKKAAQIIKSGGYATATDYVSKLCALVEQYGLTRFNVDYSPAETAPAADTQPAKTDGTPFLVKVKTGMNIRKGPGTTYTAYRDCPVGIFTIVEVSPDGDWGRLKAGGWIYIAQPRWVERK